MSLQKLSPTTTRRLTSAQAISSVSDAVKELVENALDSGASAINVKLVNYGLDRIEVQDDGSGVSVSQVEVMCLPYYTSKINGFSDLESKLDTYGFRGVALASLCNVADVVITTRTQNDEYASVFTFDKTGKVLNCQPSHFKKGTTVAVLNIFSNMPVRKKFMTSSNKSKTEFKNTEIMVKNFAVINTGVYFSFSHNKCVVWQKSPATTLKESAVNVLGYSISSMLEEVFTSCKKSSIVLVLPKRYCKGLVDLCLTNVHAIRIFINKRPVKYSKLQKIILSNIAEYFGGNYPQRKYPTCIVDITVPSSDIDVNIEANKTKVFLHEEDEIFAAVEKLFKTYYKLPEAPNVAKQPQMLEERDQLPSTTKVQKQLFDNAPKHQHDAVFDEKIQDTEVEVNTKPSMKTVIPAPDDKQPRLFANSAVTSSNSCMKTASSIVVQAESLRNVEEISTNKSSIEQNFAKRPRIDTDDSPTCFNVKQAVDVEHVNDMAVNQQIVKNKDELELNSLKKSTLSAPTTDSLWRSADSAMSLWSRGCVKTASGDIIQGGAVILQPKCKSSNGEAVNKKIQDTTSKHKPNLGSTNQDKINSRKFNSFVHSVSSQLGCKEMSGFTNFCRERRPKILQETPGMSFTAVAKCLSAEWSKLTNEEKYNYEKNINIPKSTITTINKDDNRSIVEMFKKTTQNKMKMSTTWCIPAEFWKSEPQPVNKHIPASKKLELLHQLLPEGLYICKRGLEIGIIRSFCLQEIITYRHLLENYSVPVLPMDKPLPIKKKDFKPELWQCLTSMEVEQVNTNTFEVICPIIIKNGFRLKWESGELLMTHVASTIKYYGIEELREILLLRTNSSHISQCRPQKVSAYLENQAVRWCSTPLTDKGKIAELLEIQSDLADELCIHRKPIFNHLYSV